MSTPPPEVEPLSNEEPQRLDPRSITVSRIGGWIFILIVAGFSLPGLLIALIAKGGLGLWIGTLAAVTLIAGLAALTQMAPVWQYRHTWYRVDAYGVGQFYVDLGGPALLMEAAAE